MLSIKDLRDNNSNESLSLLYLLVISWLISLYTFELFIHDKLIKSDPIEESDPTEESDLIELLFLVRILLFSIPAIIFFNP